jgi:glutamate--cysteine ligase
MSYKDANKIPHLITSLKGPLEQLEKQLLSRQMAIETWFNAQLSMTCPPVYCSVDLRNAGFKIVPVDTNLFPAGFNNLAPNYLPCCIQAAETFITQRYPGVRKILLIPEEHTRNIYYYENVAIIRQIFSDAGFEIKIGTLLPHLKEAKKIELPSKKQITLEPLIRRNNQLSVEKFHPDIILLNNDLSSGIPKILQHLDHTIIPPLHVGWYSRLKSIHFQHYQKIVTQFAQEFSLDPWLISCLFRHRSQINFMSKEGEYDLMVEANALLKQIQEKYKQYHINLKPFLAIKADAGTYGMAVMMIEDPEQLLRLNRKERTRMMSIKGGRAMTQVILQEGVYTIETWGREKISAESVIYMIGGDPVGGFYRLHPEKRFNENLNAPGMRFEPLAFEDSSSLFYPYSVIGRLAMLAAAREQGEIALGTLLGQFLFPNA